MLQDIISNKEVLARIVTLIAVLAVLLLRNMLARVLIRLLFHRIHRKDRPRYQIIKSVLIHPAAYMIVAGAFRAAVYFLGIPEPYYTFTVNATSSLFIITAIWLLYAASGLAIATLISNNNGTSDSSLKISTTAASLLSSMIRVVIIVVGILIVMSRWVKDISGLIAGFGIGGLAIALAAQDTASNLFGSIAIMLDKPFDVGEWVEVEGFMGVIEKVGLRSSRIKALDQSTVSIPNAKLANSNIVNGTRRNRRRVAFKLGVVYSTSIEKINALIDQIKIILEADDDIEKETTMVFLDSFASSSIDIFICYFTAADYMAMMKVKERINFAILAATEAIGVSIAFPSMSVYREN